MTSTATPALGSDPAVLPDDASGVLAYAREQRAAADLAERRLLEAAVQWAIIHPAETLDDAEGYASRVHLAGVDEQPVTLAGPGAPLVREFTVAEFAAAIGVGTETGKHYLGHAIELRYRLPRLWARVTSGDLPAWKARRVAVETISHALTTEAAGFVDAHVAPVAHKIRPVQLARLVEEAIGRYMPDHAEKRRRRAADGRHFTIDRDQISFAGTSRVTGELDLTDALDLEDAIRGIAAQLADLGSDDTLDVRRSIAAGELARRQLALDLTCEDEPDPDLEGEQPADTNPPCRTRKSGTRSRTVLHLHLSQAALEGRDAVGRVENTRCPVTADQIREWCGRPDTALTVKPVVDLEDHVHVDAYEVPDRIAEQVALRDHSCVFPWCTRPARNLRPDEHPCDCDHVVPYDPGGPPGQTCSCAIAPLCRRHHRLKTHSAWTYTILEPGSFLWTSPQGYQFLRDHEGTLDVTADRRNPRRPRPRD
ncbi:HNH endonuclease signature motif containing protein [Nocardioides sp.]|uniref:HNH endonuclease signature motif containing protein n=1 Tax=Nocardioides sp. TaxID=35761 RepID=UPI002ED611D7